jgi:hypothetical protein
VDIGGVKGDQDMQIAVGFRPDRGNRARDL